MKSVPLLLTPLLRLLLLLLLRLLFLLLMFASHLLSQHVYKPLHIGVETILLLLLLLLVSVGSLRGLRSVLTHGSSLWNRRNDECRLVSDRLDEVSLAEGGFIAERN